MQNLIRTVALILMLLTAHVDAWAQTRPPGGKIPVVASFSILGDMVGRVGGGRIDVKILVGPDVDAHIYEPTLTDVSKLQQARVVVENGLRFEGWLGKLMISSGYTGEVITATKGVSTIPVLERRGHHDKHGPVHGEDADPHAWHNLANALIYVRNIKDGLCKIDIDGCYHYAANANAYSAQLKTLDGHIRQRVAAIPLNRRKVITSHHAFGYFAQAYSITFLSPQGVSTEREPSASDLAQLIEQIRTEKVTALFVENISDPQLTEQISRATGVKPGGVIYSDALSKRDGDAPTYLDLMRHNANLITGAMAGSS